MKKILFLALAGVIAAGCKPAGNEPSGPVVWKCDFKGKYTEEGKDTAFTWKVTWTEEGTNGKITGESTEEAQKSTTVGTCTGSTCKIDETYTAGENKGKTFYWTGDFTDAATRNENVYVTTFKGKFGPSDTDRTSMGSWEASANCSR